MKVLNFKQRHQKKSEILFGIVLPKIVYALYEVALSEEAFEAAIKKTLNIHPMRFTKLVEAVQGDQKEVLILVIYDKIIKGKTMLKEKLDIKLKDFDFDIYTYNFNQDINIEFQIEMEKRSR